MQKLGLVLLKNKYEQLTRVEKQIADYILEHPSEILNLSVAQLAQRAQTAGSAVIRLCQNIGFQGFREFKLSLASELAEQDHAVALPSHITKEDSIATAFQKTFASSIKALQNTLQLLDNQQVQSVVEALCRAKQICFFGVGTSSTIAIDAHYRIMQLGHPASYATDILYMQVSAQNLDHNDAAVGISHSGQTVATIEALKRAKANGAYTIALTSFKDSPISQYADVVLNVFSDDSFSGMEAVSARIAHIALLDAIMVGMALQNYERTISYLEKRDEARALLKKR